MSIASIICRGLGPGGSPQGVVRRGLSSFQDLPDIPSVGFQYVLAGASPWDADSIFDADSTAGDVAEISLAVTPSSDALFMGTDGLPYLQDLCSGRQQFQYREWVTASRNWLPITGGGTYSIYYINDTAPEIVRIIPTQFWTQNTVVIPLILDDYVQDAQGDTITWTGTLPTGVSIATVTYNSGQPNQRTVQQIQGTPTVAQATLATINLTANDNAGKTTAVPIDYVTAPAASMPNVVGLTYAAGQTALTGYGNITLAADLSIGPLGLITVQSPIAGAPVASDTPITLSVRGVNVFDQHGASYAAALAAFSSQGLTVSPATASAFAVVLDQSIPAGTFIYAFPATIVLTLASATGNMPDVRGLELAMAQQVLQAAGVLVPDSIGYFGTWPITVKWAKGNSPGIVVDQDPAPGAQAAPNSPVTLTVIEYPVAVAYP